MSDTLLEMTGMSVLVTGASSDLGGHFAPLFACRGAHAAVAARSVDRLAGVCKPLLEEGLRVQPVTLDVVDGGHLVSGL